jgi:hypothetical protein
METFFHLRGSFACLAGSHLKIEVGCFDGAFLKRNRYYQASSR